MAIKKTNLSDQQLIELDNAKDLKISIIRSEWNPKITNTLAKAAKNTLIANGISKNNISEIDVPGTFELPLGAKIANKKHHPDAIICLGCVIKGETDHDKYISNSVASAIQMLNLSMDKPVIFGVLTPNTMEQAKERAGGKHGNKGDEAATTALKMIKISAKSKTNKIGY